MEAGKMVMNCNWSKPSTSGLIATRPECPYILRPYSPQRRKAEWRGAVSWLLLGHAPLLIDTRYLF